MELIENIDRNVLQEVKRDGEKYFLIQDIDRLRPFFMSIVSQSDHWMFISSNGGVTAGRKNSTFALFPYYTDDKITESNELTGSKTIFQVYKDNEKYVWEPFSVRNRFNLSTTRNLYKSKIGNSIIFEEINHDLQLTFAYQWNSSEEFGFVKSSSIRNHSNEEIHISILDGIQNVMPYGVPSDLQNASSNLVDAYKRTELYDDHGIAIFALSAIIVDKAVPSEALKANVAWSVGLDQPTYLLSSLQLDAFRSFDKINTETDVKAEKGAFFIQKATTLHPNEQKDWKIISEVNQNHSKIIKLADDIQNQEVEKKIQASIQDGTHRLKKLVASSDGMQKTDDKLRDARHFSNTLFNIMRGGIFKNNYRIDKDDFTTFILNANSSLEKEILEITDRLGDQFTYLEISKELDNTQNPNLMRLGKEYLPLRFSRRHGDPSRPWNQFSINLRTEEGDPVLDYEGNWRDIFQNWEALAYSYPLFIDGMIFKFLNASTFEGYNPYRVTREGFDWEIIEPDDPWSYIGYWGDHQIIYLLKFLEFIEKTNPSKLRLWMDKSIFVYANVPYKIKPFENIVKNPKDTIDFDEKLDAKIRKKRNKIGEDGSLLFNPDNEIIQVNFIEKLLVTTLSKLSNYIQDGGIWMNTQRPEWNDANNALVGNGVSMVTLYYLRRFLAFLKKQIQSIQNSSFHISKEVKDLFDNINNTFQEFNNVESSDESRLNMTSQLGKSASDYRWNIYKKGFSGEKSIITGEQIIHFIENVLPPIDKSIFANQRPDGMYHAYNLATIDNKGIALSYLPEMLEGQVAVLSSKLLKASQSLELLDMMKKSALFRHDHYSYLLYPNNELPSFMDKNSIEESQVMRSKLLQKLLKDNNQNIIKKDIHNGYHFHGNFTNATDLKEALEQLESKENKKLVSQEKDLILQIFEEVFNHKAFTGRSGTFYGYEGLGSIYWHMVSKLQLAVQESALDAIENNESPETVGRLLEHYYEINEGIGVHKPPQLYGAFPTDPYSHTPQGKGAQQPGMTGQVKEDILSRFGELGAFYKNGTLYFDPCLLRENEFLSTNSNYVFYTVEGDKKTIELQKGTLFFTICQIPIVYHIHYKNIVKIDLNDGSQLEIEGLQLTENLSNDIFSRNGKVLKIEVYIDRNILK